MADIQILHNVLPSEIIQKFDYNTIFAWLKQPISFLMALSVKTQIYIVLVLLAIIFVVIPLIRYLMAKTYATIDPIKFELQHVMIVGASDGLGKELVREVFMKGALVTMIGRDENKLKEIRDELDFNT